MIVCNGIDSAIRDCHRAHCWLAGSLALLVIPVRGVASYWWIPPILDYGCLPGLFHMSFLLARRSWPE
jgi:hypothetical protein